MLTKDELDAIAARNDARLQGDWKAIKLSYPDGHDRQGNLAVRTDVYIASLNGGCIADFDYFDEGESIANAQFAAHATKDIPALLQHIRELEIEIDKCGHRLTPLERIKRRINSPATIERRRKLREQYPNPVESLGNIFSQDELLVINDQDTDDQLWFDQILNLVEGKRKSALITRDIKTAEVLLELKIQLLDMARQAGAGGGGKEVGL